jgi:hypothetical protein
MLVILFDDLLIIARKKKALSKKVCRHEKKWKNNLRLNKAYSFLNLNTSFPPKN